MILSGQTIRKTLVDGKHIVEPFCERTVQNGMSYGLSHAGYDIRVREAAVLRPGGSVLLSSIEEFTMPLDVLGIVHDKSTWARRFIAAQNTVLEAGWKGWLTLEITNHGEDVIAIQAGDPIAQIVFHRIDQPVEGYVGKYQHQPARPVGAIEEA